MKSVVLIGKGPSLLRCSKEFIDKFDDIAIIGYPPPTQDFLKIIRGNKIKYHFCNCGDPYIIKNTALYNDITNEELGIEEIWDYGSGNNNYKSYITQKNMFKGNIKNQYLQIFKDKYNFDKWGPSGGIYALHHILKQNKYNKIGLVGFDNFEEGKQRYYFDVQFYQPSLRYLIKPNGPITPDNITNHKALHDTDTTRKYLENIFKDSQDNISYEMYTTIKFKNMYNNVNLY